MYNLPFSEKYRPRKLEDLIVDPIIYNKIKSIINNKDIPNIIFTGKSGVGKTSTIHCIARAIYPKNDYQDSILELNASDDRGIKSVHETIINFCKKKIFFKEGYAQHKLLILDEADNITQKAQRLINSIMEKYPSTRFAFTCNNSTDIIESIQSRCVIIRFTKPPLEHFINRIKNICLNEKITFEENSLSYLFEFCQKDLRQTINILELTFYTYEKVNIENINKICDIPSQSILKELYESIINKNIKNICFLVNKFQHDGYYSLDVLLHFIQYIKNKNIKQVKIKTLEDELYDKKNPEIINNQKNEEYRDINLINILADYSYIMSKSATNYIQLTSALLNCI
jgi:replication factor C subunit 2/4